MPLFRKKTQNHAPWRSDLGALLDELDVGASEEPQGWHAAVGGGRLFMAPMEDGTVLSGYLELEDTQEPGELAALLRRNLEPRLTWASLGDASDGPLATRFAVPLDGFDRDAVLLALEALGDDTLSARARELRDPARGEQAEQAADAAATERVQAALRTAGLPAEPGDRPGTWRLTSDRGRLDAVLRDTGESLMLMLQLEYIGGDEDRDVLRWLLLASDWGSARLGLASLPRGPGLFAACAIPAHDLKQSALSWASAQVLRLADDYDEHAG